MAEESSRLLGVEELLELYAVQVCWLEFQIALIGDWKFTIDILPSHYLVAHDLIGNTVSNDLHSKNVASLFLLQFAARNFQVGSPSSLCMALSSSNQVFHVWGLFLQRAISCGTDRPA